MAELARPGRGGAVTSGDVKLVLVAARGRNGVIGAGNDLPWRLASDLKHFKAVTRGKPVIMGRKTWDSLPRKPLPGRLNIVVTRQDGFVAEGAEVFASLDNAVARGRAQAAADGMDEVCVIGGGEIYAAALGAADRLYLTEVDAVPEGEVRFPEFAEADWREVERQAFPAGPGDEHAFVVRVLERD
ncbi:dihydrofolate reductase [Maricaulis sp. CAU 1757]